MLMLALGMGAFAQENTSSEGKGFSKGDIVLTGAVGFSQDKVGDAKTSTFTIAPSGAYFLTDNISLGLVVGYSSSKQDPADEKASQFIVGPQARYYFMPKNDFSVFLSLEAGYVSQKWEDGPAETKASGFGAAFNPGISYFVSPHFALQAAIGEISYSTLKNDDTDVKQDRFNLGVDLTNITFGLLYKF